MTDNNSTPTLLDAQGVEQYFGDACPEVAVAKDVEGTLYLLSDSEEGAFYVGIPQAEDEYGEKVDRNQGWFDRIEVDRRDNDGTVWITVTQKYGGCEARHVIALDADECWKLVHALMTSEQVNGGRDA